MLTPNPTAQYQYSNENLAGTFLQVMYFFALTSPAKFPFPLYLKKWFSITRPGFKMLTLQAVYPFVYAIKTLTA